MTPDPVDVPQDLGNMIGRGWDSAGRHTEDEVQKPEPKTADSKKDESTSLAARTVTRTHEQRAAKTCSNKDKAGTPAR